MKKKKLLLVLLSIILFLIFTACSSGKESDNTQTVDSTGENNDPIRVASLKGPTSMGLVKLISDEEGSEKSPYKFEMVTMADEIVSGLSAGKIDIATVPANVASVLYNKTGGKIKVAAINTLGVLYIVENGETISNFEDLRGKTIYTTGKGQSPEHVLNYILKQNGLEVNKDVTIEYKSEATEVATMLAGDESVIAMLPEPFITSAKMKNEKIRNIFDMTKEWNKIQGEGTLVTGVLVVRDEYLASNKEAFDEFLAKYEESIEFTNDNIDQAAKLIGDYGIIGEPVAKIAIPQCNITYIVGSELQQNLEGYLKVLASANAESIGGSLPDEEFYYAK